MSMTERTDIDDGPALVSYSEAAALTGIPRRSIAVFIERNGIVPKPMACNAMAKGVDAEGIAILRKAWKRVRVPVSK